MSNRFHNKFHRENHHSKRTGKNNAITDASYDPIASYDYPFQGEFYSDGEIVTNTYLSAMSAMADDIVVHNNLTVENDLTVLRNLTVFGNLSTLGDVSQIDTKVYVSSAIEILNLGTGPALKVTQDGTQPIAHFIDANGDDIIFDDNGYVGLGVNVPNEKLTIKGNLSATGFASFGENLSAIGSASIGGDAKVFSNLDVDGTATIRTLNTGSNNEVLLSNPTSKEIEKRSINPFVWSTTDFISASHPPLTNNFLTKVGNINGIRNSLVFDNGTNVGIGTTSPTDKLHVAGGGVFTGNLLVAMNGQYGGKVSVGWTFPPRASFDVQGTDSMIIPVGGNTGRVALSGAIRFNTNTGHYEGYKGTYWANLDEDLSSINLHDYLPLSGGTVSNLLCAEDFFVATNFTSTSSTVLPVGDSTTRVDVTGSIRYNDALSAFEGFNGSCWDTLGSVSDVDRDTYISSETNPCDDNDELEFYAAGNKNMVINLSSVSMIESGGVPTFHAQSTKVGINTEEPNKELTVNGSISASEDVFCENIYAKNLFGGKLSDADSDTIISVEPVFGADTDIISMSAGSVNSMNVSFSSVDILPATLGPSVLYVGSGAVGVNTEAPSKELTVYGSISASGDIYASNLYPLRRFDYAPGTPAISYTGISPFGYSESNDSWRITKIEYDPSGSVLSTTYSVPVPPNFGVDWTNRYTHTYI